MATPADQRLLELLDKWLVSLDLHGKYATLDDEGYFKVQAWPEHQRPNRWIIDLAKEKAGALQAEIRQRIEAGDTRFSEALELTTFLANLLGSGHIERFIPLAQPRPPGAPQPLAPQPGAPQPGAPQPKGAKNPPPARRASAAPARPPTAPQPAPTPAGAPQPGVPQPAGSTTYNRQGPPEAVREQVIADAAHLYRQGNKWYELAELISKLPDRPNLIDVRRILKDNKEVIEQMTGRT